MLKRQHEELYPLKKVISNQDNNHEIDFDPNLYLDLTKDFNMSANEKAELLTILWDIMRRFVELGWGLDSVSLLGEDGLLMTRDDSDVEAESDDDQKTEK